MRNSLRMCIVAAVLFLAFSTVFPQGCQAVEQPDALKNMYQSFLTNVMRVDLPRYNITQSGYGETPLHFNGLVPEETLGYTLESAQGTVSSFCIVQNGTITGVNISPKYDAAILFNQPAPSSTVDAAKDFLQRYLAFAEQFYQGDNSYFAQAMSILNGVNAASTDKVVGNMELKVSGSSTGTNVKWSYVRQDGVSVPEKGFSVKITENRITGFSDTWRILSAYQESIVPKEEAESYAFAQIKDINVTLASFSGSTMTPVQVNAPDWSGMWWEGSLSWSTGIGPNMSSIGLERQNTYPSRITRDPLKLYPVWGFTFYFGKPIGHIQGRQVTVWADTKEIIDWNEYGFLGDLPPTSAPQQTNMQHLPTEATKNSVSFPDGLIVAIFFTLLAILLVAITFVFFRWRRGVSKQQTELVKKL